MGAFDRLQNYSAKRGLNETSEVFDTKTPEGAFLSRIHNEGYSMYSKIYSLKDEYRLSEVEYAGLSLEDMKKYDSSLVLSEIQWGTLDDSEKSKYDFDIKYSELYTVLTTGGNQIINAVAGSGKSLRNGTKVHTKDGFVPIEKLKVGDLVYSDDGKLHSVVGIYPQDKPLQEYMCCFENDYAIYCSGDHLWTDFNGITRTTDEMYNSMPRCGFVLPKVLARYDENCETNKYIAMSVEKREDMVAEILADSPDSFTPLEFTDVDEYLDVIELFKSLGYVITAEHIDGDTYSFIPKRHHRMVEIIKTENYSEMTCIEIDSPTHLYLTETDIPTHNTTGLVLKILHDIVTGEAMTLQGVPGGNQVRVVNKMWVCTFLKTGAVELEQALTSWQRKLGYSHTANQISFSTMDAEFKRCLNAMGVATPIGDSSKLNGLLIKAINSCNITREGGYNLTNEDYQIIGGIVTYYRGRLDQKRYQHPSCKDYGLTPSILDLLVRQFENLRHTEGVMDFEEVMELLYKYLYVTPNPAVQDFVANRYNYIYADEFQDTSQMAYAILKFYARGKLAMNGGGIKPENNGVETVDMGTELVEDERGGLTMQKVTANTMPTMTDGLYTGCTTLGKFTVVGDTSQCIVPDSPIITEDGIKDIECINEGDKVLACIGKGKVDYVEVSHASSRYYDGVVYEVITASGKKIVGTPDHKIYVNRNEYGMEADYAKSRLFPVKGDTGIPLYKGHCGYGDDSVCEFDRNKVEFEIATENETFYWNDDFDEYIIYFADVEGKKHCVSAFDKEESWHKYFAVDTMDEIDEVQRRNDGGTYREYAVLFDIKDKVLDGETNEDIWYEALWEPFYYCCTSDYLWHVKVGDFVVVYDKEKGLYCDMIKSIQCYYYHGEVYDITTPDTRNFITDGIVSHNCIYSFRGSDSKILSEDVAKDFNPTINTLSCNWRCPSNILNPVVPSIHVNPDSANQNIIASREGGEFFAYKFTSYKNMVTQLKKDILKDMDDDMSVAILCRTNFDGMIPAFVLESEGKFDFSISGENMTLNSPLPRKIIGVSSLFTERSTPAVKNALSFFVGRRGEWQLRQLMDILKTNNKNIWQIPMADIKYSCPMLEEFVQEIRDIIMPDGVNRDKNKEIEALRAIYCMMITDVFSGDSAYCESARAYLETLLYIIDNNNFKTIYEFLEEIEFLNDKLQGRIKKAKAPIQIATVHEFKGKERDSVYIWNDSEGTFPSSKCDEKDIDQLNEERRVHYIACTRAKKREHIYTIASKVSRFVNEMDLTLENPVRVGVTLQK